MKVVETVPHVGNEASGPSYVVVRLSKELATQENEVLLLSVGKEELPTSQRFRHEVYPKASFPSPLWRSPDLYRALLRHAVSSDVIHSHSLWVMPNVYPGWASRETDTPLVISPHGTLSEWAWRHSRVKKRIVWHLLQKSVVKRADLLHATSDREYRSIRRRGFDQPVCILPNGIDVPDRIDRDARPEAQSAPQLLFLGRVHPTKGVDVLLRAWSVVSTEFPDWRLRVVGPDDSGYLDKMRSLARELGLERVSFPGPLFGSDKWKAYEEAALYVLPTHSENFGVTVAESLASGTPAIVTREAPWSGLETCDAGWWIESGVDPLVGCLREALTYSPEELRRMGQAGRAWVQDTLSWDRIAERMSEAYHWLLSGGNAPECVRLE